MADYKVRDKGPLGNKFKAGKIYYFILFFCLVLLGGAQYVPEIVGIKGSSGNQLEIDSEGQAHVVMEGKLDTNNSTTTPLDIDGVYIGTATNILSYSSINLLIETDQESASGGLQVEFSMDGVTWHGGESFTVPANTAKFYTPPVQGVYYRITYTNGGIAQTSFHLHCVLKKQPIKWSSHNLNSNLNDDDDGTLVVAVNKLRTAANTYVSQTATSSGNAKISLEELESGISVNSNSQLKITPYFSDGTEYEQISGKLRTSSVPYLYDIAEGNIANHEPFAKYGRVSGVDNTLVDVWYGEGGTHSVYVFPLTAQQFEILSSSPNDDDGGTGINSVYIEGLDANYAEISETITLDGVTPVTTVNSYLRLNHCMAATVGTGEVAAGNIIIQNTGNTVTYGAIPTGTTICRDLHYTVPAGKTLHLTSITVASGKGGNTTNLNAVIFTPKVRPFGSTVWYPQGELLTINSDIVRPLESPATITEKSDLKMSVKGDYATGDATCIGAVRGWIEDN